MSVDVTSYRQRLGRTFPEVDRVFEDRLREATHLLTPAGVDGWLEGAIFLGKLGRGAEPMLIFLEEAPLVAAILGESSIVTLKDMAYAISRTPNGDAITPFLQTAATAARRLEDASLFDGYLSLIKMVMEQTTTSVHSIVATHPSPCLIDFLSSVPSVLTQVPLAGMKNWVAFGINGYAHDPEGQSDYFALQSPESHNVLSRERHGTLLVDHERLLNLYLRGCWDTETTFRPYSLLFDEIRQAKPYWDRLGVHLPDLYDDREGIAGINRYRAALAHLIAHQRWTVPTLGDNLSPFQQLAAETFEDMRVEQLAMCQWPGLRPLWRSLHPKPVEGAAPENSCDVHHRLAMLSYAALDPDHGYQEPVLNDFLARFMARIGQEMTTEACIDLARAWYVASKKPSDRAVTMYLEQVEVDYRDDNRHMWLHHEQEDDATGSASSDSEAEAQEFALPPRHYDEWDQRAQRYLPDWVSLYERLHPLESPAKVDRLLEKHAQLSKRLERLIDMLKPQNKVRIRFQEEGSELDLDVAIRSLIDLKAGSQPDPRINMSHRTDGRSIAVSLLLDLSVSLNERPPGCNQTILELSQEAVSLLAWAVEKMGDPLAIGGFNSNSRHEVRYYHFKGFSEGWGDEVKGRIAAMEGAWSTRMGAAMRHAGEGLKQQQTDKKLLLILTDGRPHDVDVKDARHLIDDARKATHELDSDGIYPYCINLDPQADEYVADIFGNNYTVIDNIERLPERLPELFISLTK
ncbi:MAG: hypothetical protein R8J84_00130 [Mariprofundales bacterium]